MNTYGGTETHYHAASWAADNFSWTGGAYAKVLILVTDEYGDNLSSYSYSGLTGEAAISKKKKDNNILLNVITYNGFYSVWDGVVYSSDKGTPGDTSDDYLGLFNLDNLRTNAETFTTAFVNAKLEEVTQHNPTIPEPATMVLFGLGLLGLAGVSRKK